MSFKEQIASDMAVFFNTDEFAETILYQAFGSRIATDVSAIVLRDPYEESNGADGREIIRTARVLIRSDAVTPGLRDVLTFDGRTWTVAAVEHLNNVYRVVVTSNDVTEKSRENYRMQRR